VWEVLIKPLCKIKPTEPLQGQALRVLQKKSPPQLLLSFSPIITKGSIFFVKTLQFSHRSAFWLHKVLLMVYCFYKLWRKRFTADEDNFQAIVNVKINLFLIDKY